MIHSDTNYLIRSLVPGSAEETQLSRWWNAGEVVNLSAIAWAEFLCGPNDPVQHRLAKAVFSQPESFTHEDGTVAAQLFKQTGRRRATLADCMIAAVSIRVGAALATQNIADFQRFVPFGLRIAVTT